ncbi:MAG: RidA family protein [Hyphomicrobiales bacterium]
MADHIRKEALNPKSLFNSTAMGFSQAVKVGDLVFCSGQVGRGETLEQQAREALVNVRTLLGSAGCTMSDIVKMTIYSTDEQAWEKTADLRAEFLPPPFPASTFVVVRALALPQLKIEIDVTAMVGAG